MRVVSADKEQCDWHTKKEFLGRCVLCPVIDLLPHVEVVKGAAVEIERNAADMVEHDVGAKHVGHVGKGPRRLLRDTRNGVKDNLGAENQDKMNGPGTFSVCPVGVEIRQRSLITDLLEGLRRLMVDLEDTARSPPSSSSSSFSSCVSLGHVEIDTAPTRRFVRRVVGDGALK